MRNGGEEEKRCVSNLRLRAEDEKRRAEEHRGTEELRLRAPLITAVHVHCATEEERKEQKTWLTESIRMKEEPRLKN